MCFNFTLYQASSCAGEESTAGRVGQVLAQASSMQGRGPRWGSLGTLPSWFLVQLKLPLHCLYCLVCYSAFWVPRTPSLLSRLLKHGWDSVGMVVDLMGPAPSQAPKSDICSNKLSTLSQLGQTSWQRSQDISELLLQLAPVALGLAKEKHIRNKQTKPPGG